MWPHLPQLDGTDTHVYFGWYHGDERDLPRFLAAVPRMARFVTEFGAQAVPDTADFIEPERWPDLDWDRLAERHKLQKSNFDRYVPPADYATFDEWRAATQRVPGAASIERHIEELRRLKYRPNGGFAQFCLRRRRAAGVVVGARPRAGARSSATTRCGGACAPVIVVADRLPATMRPGEAIALDVHVVSDLRAARSTTCSARRRCRGPAAPTGGASPATCGADACVRVGTLQLEAPARGRASSSSSSRSTGAGLPEPRHRPRRRPIVTA